MTRRRMREDAMIVEPMAPTNSSLPREVIPGLTLGVRGHGRFPVSMSDATSASPNVWPALDTKSPATASFHGQGSATCAVLETL